MYTQCSHCDTVFQLTAETLRAAGGQVRCGRCGEVFNALARLAEDASAFATPGESALEMEARADAILHSPSPSRPAPPESAPDDDDIGASDFARLELIEKFKPPHEPGAPPPPARSATAPAAPARAPASEATAAPPASAADGDKTAPAAVNVPQAIAPGTTGPIGAESTDEGALEFTVPPGELDRVFFDPTAGRAHLAPSLSADAGSTRAPSARPVHESAETARERASGLDLAERVRRDVLAGLRRRPFDEPGVPVNQTARFAWGGAAVVLALALLAQMIHENRAWLAAHGPLRGPLQGLYAALGVKVQPPVNLSAYQLRQWGVTGDPSAAGTLRVRASILNTSAQLQPYPLLRVTLANRFGTRIGTRDFEPAEYLGRPTVRMMTPGERADATLDIQDPGKDAEGFEIDVCLRGADQAIACAADAATQAKP